MSSETPTPLPPRGSSHSQSLAASVETRRRYLPKWWWGLFGIGIGVSLALQRVELAFSYIAGVSTLLVMLLIALVRYARLTSGGLLVRGWPLLLLLLALFGLGSTVRVDDMTGNLVPTRVSWRWQPKHDQRLASMPGMEHAGADLTSTGPNDFPQYLGPDRNATVLGLRLTRDWSSAPEEKWRIPIGAGWSAFAAVNGFAVTMEQRSDLEIVSCYEIDTGTLVWSSPLQVRHETVPGGVGPRSTPTIYNGRVYSLGATGVLRCLQGADGSELWQEDLLERLGMSQAQEETMVAWGRSASPLIDEGHVIVPVGGPTGPSLMALDAVSGDFVWQAGNHQVSYASPMIAVLDGVRQFVVVCQDYVCGHDANSGSVLWEYPWPGKSNANATCSQPIVAGDNLLFLSKAYAHGAALVEVRRAEDGTWQAKELWQRRVMKTKFSNPVLFEGHVYGLDDNILACVDLLSGKQRWKAGRYGHGQLLRVDDTLLIQAESGDVVLVAMRPDKLEELGRFPALHGKTWNTPCLYGNLLLVRNGEEAACFALPTETP